MVVKTKEKPKLVNLEAYRKGQVCLYKSILCQEGYCSCCWIFMSLIVPVGNKKNNKTLGGTFE